MDFRWSWHIDMVSLNVANGLLLLGVLVTGWVDKSDCKTCREIRCGCLIWLYTSAALKQPIPLPHISILSKANPLKHFQHMCASTWFSMSQVYEGLNSQPSPWHGWIDRCEINLATFTWVATETETSDQQANFKPGSCHIPVIPEMQKMEGEVSWRPYSETNKQR